MSFAGGSPSSASPAPRAPLDRAVFPWVSPSATLRSAQRNSQTSLHSSSNHRPASWEQRGSANLATSSGWQGTMSRQNTGSLNGPNFQEDNTRHWSFLGFEWSIFDVARLRNFVEGEPSEGQVQDDFEVLRNSPIINNRFKLEVAAMDEVEADADALKPSHLSLYLTPMMEMEVGHEIPTSIMVAVKCLGKQGAGRPEWAHEQWSEWVFRQGSEGTQPCSPTNWGPNGHRYYSMGLPVA